MILEVCIDSVESAIAAQQGGASRVELCADLEHGGTTPSIGMMKSVRGHTSLKVHVMIRPRPGNFNYSDFEIDVMKNDIREAGKLGADGVVFGLLKEDRSIDAENAARLIQAARPMSVTFHRAFDESIDLRESLSVLMNLGVDRVLTSGGKPTVKTGMHMLADLVHNAGSSIKILAGGGITLENVRDLVEKTGIDELHVLSCVSTPAIAETSGSELSRFSPRLVDAARVRRILDILQRLSEKK